MRFTFALSGFMMLCMGAASASAAECIPTPSTATAANHAPESGSFPSGNNLVRPAGKSIAADGQPLRLHGRVLDRACKPVIGAVVELWQTNRDGIYQVADRAALANPYAVFAGAGRTTTDNTGSFDFYTIFPGATLDASGPRAPLLHLRLRNEHMKTLTTELFFDAEQRNDADASYSKLGAADKQALTLHVLPQPNGIWAETLLVLDGKAPYVQY